MQKADASPTKDFFVRMITRDISLEDCILDLIDNCVDGARRTIAEARKHGVRVDDYKDFRSTLHITPDEFRIEDNCGGISISDAIDYAFHFGRRPDAPPDADYSIGLYGIGMKRALLKIGKNIEIHSSTSKEAFVCTVDVDEWITRKEWTFDLADAEKIEGSGTRIRIRNIYNGIAEEFGDKTFENHLTRIIARDYSLFLSRGFNVTINGTAVEGIRYEVRESDEFKPYRKSYMEEGGVSVQILAGMAAPPPDSYDPSDRLDTSYDGWFVLCNDRVVLAADKTERTVWGDEGFPRWHPQYNGFMGMVLFGAGSKEAGLLPWTTTKRDVDESSPIYRRAVNEMKVASGQWIEYTNQRKADLEVARRTEEQAKSVPFLEIKENLDFKLPAPSKPKVRIVNVHYQRSQTDIKKAAHALGNENMPASRVGDQTFEYFLKNEVGE